MGEAAAKLRLFFALWPEVSLQMQLAAWAKRAAGRARVMRAENLHLTLAFLGDTDAARLPELLALDLPFGAHRLVLDRAGYWKHNRIIWCGAEEEPAELAQLVAGLRARLDALGIAFDHKAFVSHVTLARNARGLDAAQAWTPIAWEVRDFALVQSSRVEGRVLYQVLRRYPATTA